MPYVVNPQRRYKNRERFLESFPLQSCYRPYLYFDVDALPPLFNTSRAFLPAHNYTMVEKKDNDVS